MFVKKAIIITLLLAVLMLAGCGTSDKVNESASPSNVPEASGGAPSPSDKPEESSAKPGAATTNTAERGPATQREQEIIDSFIKMEAPDFTLEDKVGNKVTLSELKGTPVVLNFWATWCPYCIQEFGIFSEAQKNFPEIRFYAIDTNEKADLSDKNNRKANEEFAREKNLTLPVLFDAEGKVFNEQYTTQGLPSTFLIDSEGNVRIGFAGAVPDYKTLEEMLNALLKAE